MSHPTCARPRLFAALASMVLTAGVTVTPVTSMGAPATSKGPTAEPNLRSLYRQVSSAVVGIRCRSARNQSYFGTGTVIDPTGLVLTSTTVVPQRASDIFIYLRGARVVRAELVASDESLEFVLLRITSDLDALKDAAPGAVALGDSDGLQLGDPVYALGNAFESIQRDDQVALSAGIVSGLYQLAKARGEATYVGPVIETSAPVNGGMDGGPLLDAQGRLLGVLSLNYSRSRWLGTAVPVNRLKTLLAHHRDWYTDHTRARLASGEVPDTKTYLGVELEEVGGQSVRVVTVAMSSPAERAGLQSGAVLRSADGRAIDSLKVFRDIFADKRPGETVELEWTVGEQTVKQRISIWGRY